MFKMDDEYLNILSQKEKLGYSFESYIQQLLWLKFRIPFNGNPLSPLLWKHCIGTGTDIDTNNLALELKFVQYRVYPCHVLNHVIPRFNGVVGKRKVVLTNNKALWTNEAISILSDYDIELWDINDLVNYYSVPSFISVYSFVRRDGDRTTLYNAIRKYSNAINEYSEYNKKNTMSNNAENSATIGENSAKSEKEKRKSMDSIDVSPYKAQAKPKESPKERNDVGFKPLHGKKYPPSTNLRCYRCGSLYPKGMGSRYFCSNCLPHATEQDKNMHLWWYTKQWYLKTYNTIITCPYCQKEVNVLDEIQVVGQYIRHFYHASCYERLLGEDDEESKETISVIIVNSDGTRRETIEVV